MVFDVALGIIVMVFGASGLLVAWWHPMPSSNAVARALAWPWRNQDRTDVVLRSVFVIAIGALLLLTSLGSHVAAVLAVGVVFLGTGIALGVRQRVH